MSAGIVGAHRNALAEVIADEMLGPLPVVARWQAVRLADAILASSWLADRDALLAASWKARVEAEFADLRAAAQDATPGPWEVVPSIHGDPYVVERGQSRFLGHGIATADHRDDYGRANAAYIAAADPTTILRLLDALLADLPGDAGALDEAGVRADERAKTGARIADAIDDFSPYPIEHVAAFAEAARIARADAQGDGGGR